MRLRIIFLSIFLFAILLSGCNNRPGHSPIVAGDIVGVWQTADFNDNPLDFAVEMYITNDNNLHIVILSGSQEWIFHYRYKMEEDEFTWTPVMDPSNQEYEERLEIALAEGRIVLSAKALDEEVPRDGIGKVISDHFISSSIALYQVSEEVSFGWTDSEMRQMAKTREWVLQEILEHGERLSEALGFAVGPYKIGDTGEYVLFIMQHDYEEHPRPIVITFGDELPTPTQARRHSVSERDRELEEIEEMQGSRSVRNERFIMNYSEGTPRRWANAFVSLYHPVQTFINENHANLEIFWIDVFGEANRQVSSFYFEAGGGNELIVTFYLLEGFYEFYELWEPEMNFQFGISGWWEEFDVITDEIVAIQESMGWSYFVYTLRFEESTGSLFTCGFDSGGLFFLDISLQ